MRAKIAFSIVFAAAMLLQGCGGEEDSAAGGAVSTGYRESAGGCAEPDGVYRARIVERSGDCGPLPNAEQIVTLDPNEPSQLQLRLADSCAGRQELVDDGCTIESDYVCELRADGEPLVGEYVGTVTWDSAGRSAEGVAQITARDDYRIVCSSTYDVAYERI